MKKLITAVAVAGAIAVGAGTVGAFGNSPPDDLDNPLVYEIDSNFVGVMLASSDFCPHVRSLRGLLQVGGMTSYDANEATANLVLGTLLRESSIPDSFGEYNIYTPAAIETTLDYLESC